MKLLSLLPLVMLSGCASLLNPPETLGERSSAFTYVPIDPFTVNMELGGENCPTLISANDRLVSLGESELEGVADLIRTLSTPTDNEFGYRFVELPQAFPDNHVRIAYKSLSANGEVSYGPVSTTQRNSRYQIIIDYINADVINQSFLVLKQFCNSDGECDPVALQDRGRDTPRSNVHAFSLAVMGPGASNASALGSYRYTIEPIDDDCDCDNLRTSETIRSSFIETSYQDEDEEFQNLANNYVVEMSVPIYIGVGLRVIADVVANESGANLSGLDLIAASAELGQVSGSLTVQTIGLNGESISAALPIQSELNRTTVQSAIASLGAVKALMYDNEVEIQPRVVGIYNPIGGDENVVNSLVSNLSARRPTWQRPCEFVTED